MIPLYGTHSPRFGRPIFIKSSLNFLVMNILFSSRLFFTHFCIKLQPMYWDELICYLLPLKVVLDEWRSCLTNDEAAWRMTKLLDEWRSCSMNDEAAWKMTKLLDEWWSSLANDEAAWQMMKLLDELRSCLENDEGAWQMTKLLDVSMTHYVYQEVEEQEREPPYRG